MKRSLKITLLLPLALTGSLLLAQDTTPPQSPPAETQQDAQQSISGRITKADNGKYVLMDSTGTMYKLDDQTMAKKYAGKKVRVSGTVDTSSNTIHVTDIQPS